MRHCWQTFFGPGEREKVKPALRELEDIGNRYKHIGNQGLEQLTNSITPRLRNLLDVVSILNAVFVESYFQNSSRFIFDNVNHHSTSVVLAYRSAIFLDSRWFLKLLMRPSSKTCMRGRLKVYFVSIFVYYHGGMPIYII